MNVGNDPNAGSVAGMVANGAIVAGSGAGLGLVYAGSRIQDARTDLSWAGPPPSDDTPRAVTAGLGSASRADKRILKEMAAANPELTALFDRELGAARTPLDSVHHVSVSASRQLSQALRQRQVFAITLGASAAIAGVASLISTRQRNGA